MGKTHVMTFEITCQRSKGIDRNISQLDSIHFFVIDKPFLKYQKNECSSDIMLRTNHQDY